MADRDIFRAPVGTYDVLPPESERWIALVADFGARASRFGFDLVVTPLFEHREVFERVGESTDIVRKEMYEFEDKGGRSIVLRPDGTAPTVRAYLQHRPTPPWKVWYVSPHFRYERPQRGRNRQFFQVGAEALGVDDPEIDIEVIDLAWGFYRDLGLTGVSLMLNTMGDEESRARYVAALRAYYSSHAAALGSDFAERVEQNPLRLFDAKRDDWLEVIEKAPQITEHLNDDSFAHFEQVQRGLDDLGIPYEIDPRLVRGLDYYTSTTFEFTSDVFDSAQNAVGGGGRFDRLAEAMGGPPTPGIGFAIGIDRLLLACDEKKVFEVPAPAADVFVVNGLGPAGAREVTLLGAELRENGFRAERGYDDKSVKTQWKLADRSHAVFGIMLGKAEAERNAVAVKDLRTGEQVEVERNLLVGWLQQRLEQAPS